MEPEQTAPIGKRLSKYKRKEDAVPHVLTDRDMAIIAAVADYRLLARSQIQRLLGFGATTRVNFRLQKLFHHGYLARHFLPTLKGSSQAIYTLDRLGLPVAAERLGRDTAPLWRPTGQIKPLFLSHELAVNDVRAAFELSARAYQDHQLVTWLSAEQTKDQIFFGASWHTLAPDAFLRYRVAGHILSGFVEVDRGTMSNRRFKDKVERYFKYDVSGRFAERYKGQRFRVFVLTRTIGRLVNLKQTTAQIAQRNCWFTTLAEITKEGPLAAIWQVVGLDEKVPLF